ncbi:MAG: hypothetical protein J0L92_07595 [Deltaproteobacteria bacterium]|nr:hypothetical protein [Deltaproteobacteria bacterium]
MSTAASPPPPVTPAPSAARWRAIALMLLAASVLLAMGLWLLRSAIVTAMIRRNLATRGVSCEPFEVEASATIGDLVIAPTRCTVREGVIAGLAWDAPMRAHLEGSTMASLEVETLEVTRRAGEDEAPDAVGTALGVWMQAPARVGGVVHFASRLSEIDSPALHVARLVVIREGGQEHEHELELERIECPAREAGAPVRIAIEGLTLAAGDGPLGVSAVPRLRDVSVEADRSHGTIEGTADATLTLPGLGSLQLGSLVTQRVIVTAEQLDTQPRWSVELR